MKTIAKLLTCLSLFFLIGNQLVAQDKDEKPDKGKKPVRDPFESALIIDNQTIMVPNKGTLEFDMNHRFGSVENGMKDFVGIYSPGANIRLGLTYSPIDNLSVGIGYSKLNTYVDLSAKYAILKQRRDWSIPFGLTYYVNAAIDTRDADNFEKSAHRMAYYHELILGVRVNKKISLQVAPSLSHFNAVETAINPNDETDTLSMRNDIIGLTGSGRIKFSSSASFIFEYSHQFTTHEAVVDLKPNIGLGVELSTSSHAFQIFVSTFQGILPQHNMVWSENEFDETGILIGFNITRLWNF